MCMCFCDFLIYVIFVKVFGVVASNLMHMAPQHLWSEMSIVHLSPLDVRCDGDEQKIVDCKTFFSAIF